MKFVFLKNKEVKNAGWIIGGRIAQMLISLVVGALVARYLGPANYGLLNYGTAYVTLFTAFCNLGLNSVIIKDFVDNPNEQGEAIGSAIVMRMISSALSVFMIIGVSMTVDSSEPLTIFVVALCSLGLIFHVFEMFNYWFQFQYKSKITSIATLVAYIIVSIYKIILLILELDVRWFAFATSIDYIAIAIFLYVAYKSHGGMKLRFSMRKSRALLKISYHYILSSAMVAIYGQTDKFMLKQMLDETEVGFYACSTAICAMWVFVLQAIIDSIYPSILNLHKIDKDRYEKKNRQLYCIVFYVSVFVSIIFVIFGELAIKILYGVDFLPAAESLKVVTWYTAFAYLGVARNAWIVCEGNQRYLKYMYGCAAIMNVALNFAFIPIMGASGAALASLITQLFTSIGLPLCFKKMRPNAKLMLEAIVFKNIFNDKRQKNV